MLSKKLLVVKNSSDNFENYNATEKMKSLEEEEAFKTRAGRKRHSVQLDKRITQQLQDRRSSNVSSTGDSQESLDSKFVLCVWILLYPSMPAQREIIYLLELLKIISAKN